MPLDLMPSGGAAGLVLAAGGRQVLAATANLQAQLPRPDVQGVNRAVT